MFCKKSNSSNISMKLTKFHNNNAEIVEYLLLAKFEPTLKFLGIQAKADAYNSLIIQG